MSSKEVLRLVQESLHIPFFSHYINSHPTFKSAPYSGQIFDKILTPRIPTVSGYLVYL